MSQYILQLVITVVAVTLFLCSQSVTCGGGMSGARGRELRNHQFLDVPYEAPPAMITEENYDGITIGQKIESPGLAICKSESDNRAADLACQDLSRRLPYTYMGQCERFPMKLNVDGYVAYPTKWVAICYYGSLTVGCLSKAPYESDNPAWNTSANSNDRYYWEVKYGPMFNHTTEQERNGYFCEIKRRVPFTYF